MKLKRKPTRGRRTPAKRPRRRNGSDIEAAAKLSEKFHGRPAGRVTEHKLLKREATELTELGKAAWLDVETPEGDVIRIHLSSKTKVCSDPKGGQIYLIDGNQEVDLKKFGIADTGKHHVMLGEGVEIAYETKKSFDDFKPTIYHHELGEETGEQPLVCYDVLNRRIYLVDGAYAIEDAGEGEVSPGIVN